MRRVAKHLWKHKKRYGVATGAVSAYALGVASGLNVYGRAINYNPQTQKQLRQLKRDQDRFIKNQRRFNEQKKV